MLLLVGGTAWIATRTVAWVRELPNRIHVGEESLGDAFAESIRSGLHSSDPEIQLKTIQALAEVATQDAETRGWIRAEYTNDLNSLAASSNTDVASNAATLLSLATDDGTPSKQTDEPGR